MITTVNVHVDYEARIESDMIQAEGNPPCAITRIMQGRTEVAIFAQDSNWMRALATKLNNNADRLDEMTRQQ